MNKNRIDTCCVLILIELITAVSIQFLHRFYYFLNMPKLKYGNEDYQHCHDLTE